MAIPLIKEHAMKYVLSAARNDVVLEMKKYVDACAAGACHVTGGGACREVPAGHIGGQGGFTWTLNNYNIPSY